MTTLQVELPDAPSQELCGLVSDGWYASEDEALRDAVRELVTHRHFKPQEQHQLQDIAWALDCRTAAMKLIIADTGPLLHLDEAEAADLLPRLGEVHVTPAVLAELLRRRGWAKPSWPHLDQPSKAVINEAHAWTNSGLLDAGEAEALAHAREIQPDYFLTDGAAARTAACAALQLCSWQEAENALGALETTSTLRLSPRVKQAARHALAEIFPPLE